jgi:serine phosphatase RsbU (regulator of sigma subunit)
LPTLALSSAALGQVEDVGLPEVDLPSLPPAPTLLPPVPPAEELVDTVERATGVVLPGDRPAAAPPAPAAGAPEPAAAPPASAAPAPLPAESEQRPSGIEGSSPSARAPTSADRSGGAAGAPRNGADGERTGTAPELPEGSSTQGRQGEKQSPLGQVFEAIEELPWALMAAVAALAALGILMAARSALLVRVARRLTNQGDELRMDVGAMQSALLPTIPERIAGVEISVAYRAAQGPAAGGDFHDVLALDGDRVAVIVGDVCGHGREALTVTALVHYTVRAYLEAGLAPREALRLADEALGGKLGHDFATVLAAIYDPESSTLDYSTAGHHPPLILGAAGDHAILEMTPPPIGAGGASGFRQTSISLPSGSGICFFTDGLVEHRAEDGAMLEREGFAALLGELDDRVEATDALGRVGDSGPQTDDMTVCLVRPHGAAGDGTVFEELELDSRAAARHTAAFLLACGLDAGEIELAMKEISACADRALVQIRRGCDPTTFKITAANAGERGVRLSQSHRTPSPALAG